MADALIEYLSQRGEKEKGYYFELIDYMGDLPHLKPETDSEVKRLLPDVIKAKQNGLVTEQRQMPGTSMRTIFSMVLNIIVFIVLMFRLISCLSN